ncbi:MAG TPA: 50S ribosomal protein L18 [Candidatus Saccharimonadales bacterium]|jgi:large subunit ribosomal protein L18
MNELSHKLANRTRRKNRVRSVVSGNAVRPRLSVHVSHRHISAQLIDDDLSKTLAYSTTVGQKNLSVNMTERAAWVGSDIAKKALGKKYKSVVFDRGSKLYHGRVAALADAARQAGLEI